ncbi:MAG: hypothetical protein KDK33_01880 [Leptospiraceae bacterium]|nr:hypothetical protein [Leptospiraceae bacterium]
MRMEIPSRALKRRKLGTAFLALILTASVTGCKSIEEYFATINVAGGLDSSNVTFYTRKSDLERLYSSDSASELNRRIHSDSNSIERPFYSISSAPNPLPFFENEGFFRYMRTSFSLNSPRTYRGTLINYPDDGRVTADPQLSLFYQLYPLPDLLGRRMEFIYEEYRAYFTLYFPYFGAENWYLAFGQSYGQSRYNFDLLERNYRLASVVRQWTPVYMVSFNYGYRLGKFFPKGLLSNTYLFVEISGDARSIQPVNINIPRMDGLPSNRLYASMNYARIGIRKTISLTNERVEPDRKENNVGTEEEIEETRDRPPAIEKKPDKKPESEPTKSRKDPESDENSDPDQDSYFPY